MANPYKTIGNTAAAVVSVLAIGTLCWWQRPVTPINAPRPQDEAEIMTACLERNYAIGRMNRRFSRKFAATISERIVTNVPAVLAASSSSNAPYSRVAGNSFCYWIDTTYHPYSNGVITIFNATTGKLGPWGNVTIAASNGNFVGRMLTDTITTKQWHGSGTNVPNVLYPTNGAFGTIYLYNAPSGAVIGVRQTFTNSPAEITTNTIGYTPSAPLSYGFAARQAFANLVIAPDWWTEYGNFWEPGTDVDKLPPKYFNSLYWPQLDHVSQTGWIIPENSYMESGDTSWFGACPMTNVWAPPASYVLKVATPLSYDPTIELYTTTCARSMFVWTNYVTKPTAKWSESTTYTYTNGLPGATNIMRAVSNTVYYRPMNTYVTTNSRTLGTLKELSGMLFAFERDTRLINQVDPCGFSTSIPATKPPVTAWSTNVYNDFGRALSLLQWMRENRTACELVTWTGTYTNGVFVSLTVVTNFSTGVAGVSGSTVAPTKGVTVVGTVAKYAFTNARPFAVDNVYFVPDAITFTNGITAATWGSNPPPISVVAPYESATADWWPMTPDEMRTWVDSTAAGIEYGVDPIPGVSISMPCVAFHVQFSALTNYLDHAPAR